MSAYNLDFPRAWGDVSLSADFRRRPEDFCVYENLGFEPSGEGEHVYLHIEKRGDNTAWLARQIAHLAGVENMDVGYCGLKDRHAVTQQWFSVYLPKGQEPDWQQLNSDTVAVLHCSRHRAKLRRGQHINNRFEISLRNISGEIDSDKLARLFRCGVPNYFGEQRFGHDGNNLHEADLLLRGEKKIKNRQRKGMMTSAARSWLFNLVLAERVRLATSTAGDADAEKADAENLPLWAKVLLGDPGAENEQAASGPLWGRGRSLAKEDALAFENSVLADWRSWSDAMEHIGLQQQRRALLLSPTEASWEMLAPESGDQHSGLRLCFALPPGTYATAILREVAQLNNLSLPEAP